MSHVVAVDLGGTHIRAAYFPKPEPRPATQSKVATHASEGPDSVIERIISLIESQIPAKAKEIHIGVGAPGPLDPNNGVIFEAPNLPGWKNVALANRLHKRFNVPVALGNDANMAALAEWRFGAGIGTRHLVYLTLGTGIGGGVIIDGNLLTGTHGLAAELGHTTIALDGERCGCGQQGHVEAHAAGPAIARRAIEKLAAGQASVLRKKFEETGTIRTEDVGLAAHEGDALAVETLNETGDILGCFLATLAHTFNPEIFVLGGGVSQIGPSLFEPIRRAIRKYTIHPVYLEGLRIEPAALGDDAGLVGAMILASQL